MFKNIRQFSSFTDGLKLRRTDRTAVIVGLGNPGNEYGRTRHNVGFRCVDCLSDLLVSNDAGFRPHRGSGALVRSVSAPRVDPAVFGFDSLNTERLLLVKPQTYMNLSGKSVQALQRELGFHFSDMLVVFDDLGLQFGSLKLTSKPTATGHNGIASVATVAGKKDGSWSRLRFGVGQSDVDGQLRSAVDRPNFVLSNFTPSEEAQLANLTYQAARIIAWWTRFADASRAFNMLMQAVRRQQLPSLH